MELEKRMAAIETILFAMGDSVEISQLADALEISREEVTEAVRALEARCEQEESGLRIHWYDDAVQLSTKAELYSYLVKIAKVPRKQVLTDSLLETLSIIAFKQPVTRLEVENIRGVNSDFAISKLVSYELIEEVGRREGPGRPMLFGTTEQFLRSFGLRYLEDLPDVGSDRKEEFLAEAEREIDRRLEL